MLSREESRRHPKLELSNVSLVDAQEVDDVIRTREAKEKWREALNRAMEEDMEAPPATRGGFKALGGEAAERVLERAPYAAEQIMYDGPYPDLVLTFELRNMGRRVAKDVSGEVSVDRSFLEPINFPLFDGEVLEVGEVPPFPSEDNFIFRIALLRKRAVETTMVKTPIVVTFSTPEGDYLEERLEFAL